MVGIIEGFRSVLIPRNAEPQFGAMALSTLVAVVLLTTGVMYFRRVERNFADLI